MWVDYKQFDGHTKGEWMWRANVNGTIMLQTVDRGWVYVMGLERWRMQGAIPTFQKHKPDCDGTCCGCGVMCKATEFGEPDYNGTFTINHPDARLIQAAPLLLAEIARLRALLKEAGDEIQECHRMMATELGIVYEDQPIDPLLARIRAATEEEK
jgi:hypothetical protein